jgi:hypothetical protein
MSIEGSAARQRSEPQESRMNLSSDPVFRAYVVTALILSMNLLLLANASALTRGRANRMVNPETGG